MASESRLYSFSDETKEKLRKFRLGTSRAKEPMAVVYHIDKTSLEILADSPAETHTSLADLADSLPENTPRFALLSYPMTLPSGRQSAPYVLVSYMPATSSSEQRMLYASAKELMRSESQAGKVLEVEDEDGVLGIGGVLGEG